MLTDMKQAVRSMRFGIAPLVVGGLSLSIGIAATATMLSVVDAIDYRPLPFGDASELVDISEVDSAQPGLIGRVSPGAYRDWRERTGTLSSLAAASSIVATLMDSDGGFEAARVSDNFFATLRVQPAFGRLFDGQDVTQHSRVAVISYELWQARLNSDPQVLGRTLPLSWSGEFKAVPPEPYTIVGVLPRGVRYPLGAQLWIAADDEFGNSRDPFLTVVGRINPNASLGVAQAEFQNISAQLSTEAPEQYGRRVARVSAIRNAMRASLEDRGAGSRLTLLSIAGTVLFLTVINVAALFLARTGGQVREFRTRLALGASRSRLATFVITQSLTVSILAGVIGVVMSEWLVQLVSLRFQVVKSGVELGLDFRFVFFAFLISLLSGVVVAYMPLWGISRLSQHEVLSALSLRGAGFVRSGRIVKSMVVLQIAFAVVLLTSAGLLSTEFLRLVSSTTGFDPQGMVVASLPISMTGSSREAIAQATIVEQQIAELSNVSSVALGGLPAEGYSYRLDNQAAALDPASSPMSYRVSPGYFSTLRVALKGREFNASDREGSAPVAIVNSLAASLWWPNQDPIGKSLFMARRDGVPEQVTVVGVVDNERVRRSMTWEFRPVVYRPFAQLAHERRQVQVFARTKDKPEATFTAINRVIDEAYSTGGFRGDRVATMERLLGATLAEQRFRAWALTTFAVVALFLASMGIYGVVATMVAQRTSEFGIRIALGAAPAQVLVLVFRQGVILALTGFVLGIAGSVWSSRLLRSLLVNPPGFDARLPIAAGIVLACAVAAACYFPARRAARTDSAQLLHEA